MIKPTRDSNIVAFRTDIGTFIDINQCDQQCGRVVSGVGGLNTTFRMEILNQSNANVSRRVIPPDTHWRGYAPITISRVIV
jgi:hypothetical protein